MLVFLSFNRGFNIVVAVTYQETISFLYNLQTFGMKFGLKGIKQLLAVLGEPHRRFPTIHIAGTNGKGSTAAMIAAMFTAAGYRTAFYTSPHILRYEERIRINGIPIPRRVLTHLASGIRPFVEAHRTTFFETTTAIAFQYFAEENVDIAIIETGLGGRLDATNVLTPLVSVITTIGLEHTHILGKTLEAIAREKGGIIKNNVPLVTGVTNANALSVLKRIARRKHASFHYIQPTSAHIESATLKGTKADLLCSFGTLKNVTIELPGIHQMHNALLAVESAQLAAARGNMILKEEHIRKGLRSTRTLTGFYGRLTLLQRSPAIIMDVAHNPQAIASLVESLRAVGIYSAVVIFGVMKDKDLRRMGRALKGFARCVVAVAPKTERAKDTASIAECFNEVSIAVEEANSVAEGVRYAVQRFRKDVILITGSHFVCAEAYAYLKRKKYLTINQ